MATLFDKVKSTNLQQNSIGSVVSFSGSDITVVAYRGATPAGKFKVDNLKQKINTAQVEEEAAKVSLANVEIRLAGARSDLVATQEDIERRARQLRHSGAPIRSSGMSPLNEKEGKYQKRVTNLSSQVSTEQNKLDSSVIATSRLELDLIDASATDAYFELGSIHTLSYSSFREKFAVRALGVTQAKAYTRGPRTIAGTMVFNVLQQHDLLQLIGGKEEGVESKHPDAAMLDQVEPFNLLLLFANEYGAYSALHLLDIDLRSEGQEMSVDNIITHNTMNFYATDMIPMTSLGNRFHTYDEMVIGTIRDITSLGFTSGASLRKNKIDSFNNPFADEDEEQRLLSKSRGLF